MKRLFLILLCTAFVGVCFASPTEKSAKGDAQKRGEQSETTEKRPIEVKPLTSRWSALAGVAKFANHHISNQEYKGLMMGVEMELGRMYRRSNNVSWELNLNHRWAKNGTLGRGLKNPAGTNGISAKVFGANYATHYNWLVGEGWMFKVGGALDFYGDSNAQLRTKMNNANSIQGALQGYASAGISYKAKFEKWDLRIYGNISTPIIGGALSDSEYENGFASIMDQSITKRYDKHIVFTSVHNYQGLNGEVGLDFETKRVTVTLAYETTNRWWYATKVQNYRKASLFKLGFGVNLFQRQRDNLSNRYF